MSLSLRIAKYGLYVFVLLISFIFLRLFLFQIILVKGNSMLPTLKDGSIVLVYKRNFPQKSLLSDHFLTFGQLEIKRFDLLLFDNGDGKYLIKRLIGLPELPKMPASWMIGLRVVLVVKFILLRSHLSLTKTPRLMRIWSGT